jgi:hypothetical protein
MREFVHEPMNTLSIAMSVIAVLGFSPMYASARSMPSRRASSRSRSGSGTRPSTGTTISGDVPHVTCGWISAASNTCVAVERRALVAVQRAPQRDRLGPTARRRRERPPAQVGERRIVGRDDAGARARLDRHVADRHAAFHRQRADRRAAELDRMAGAARGADAAE